MLDLTKLSSIGEALREALETYPRELALIESDRGQEKARLTYRDFKRAALPLAKAMQELGVVAGTHVAIIMTNQSKWLISAYALFYCGAVMVPLDFKLTPAEQRQLLQHSDAEVLITEYAIWRQLSAASQRSDATKLKTVLVTEAPANTDLWGALRWEEAKGSGAGAPTFVARKREDLGSIIYSSGTGGNPKGCMLTHGNYLEQCAALTAWYPFWPGVRYLSILPTNHSIDFMVGFFGPFVCGAAVVHLRTLRPEFVREAFVRYRITYVSLVPMLVKNLERGLRAKFDALPAWKRAFLNAMIATNRMFTRRRPNVK